VLDIAVTRFLYDEAIAAGTAVAIDDFFASGCQRMSSGGPLVAAGKLWRSRQDSNL
jgi:hypothetical protein